MASALVITLAVVTLLSILLLGFLSGLRTETAATATHVNGEKAILFADMGADAAQARLAAAMPNVSKVNTVVIPDGTKPVSTLTSNIASRWIAQPGRVLVGPSGSPVPNPSPTPADLSSGALVLATDDAVDLNPATLADANQRALTGTDTAIFSTGDPAMRVRWRYVRGDGTFVDTLPVPVPTDAASQVVGRFAFWTDDMSARINVNTAWTRTTASNSTTAPSHPSRVSLAGLPLLVSQPTKPDEINNYRLTQRLFNTLPEMRPVDANSTNPVVAQMPGQYALDLTQYSHSLDLNMLGERRIVLTTQKNLAGDAEFLDILDPRFANHDPGCFYMLDTNSYNSTTQYNNKVLTVVRRLAGLLERKDWPILPGAVLSPIFGSGMTAKYPDDGWAYQTALNIIDYVRSRESKNPIVEPLRLDYFPAQGVTGTLECNSSSVSMTGNSRRPLITEIGVWFSAHKFDPPPAPTCIFKVEIYLPKNSGFASGPLDLLRPFGNNADLPAGVVNGLYLNVAIGNPDNSKKDPQHPGQTYPQYLVNVPVFAGPPHTTYDGNAYLDRLDTTMTEGDIRTITYIASGWPPNIIDPLLPAAANRPTHVILNCSLGAIKDGEALTGAATLTRVTWDSTATFDPIGNTPAYQVDPLQANGTPIPLALIHSLATTTDPHLNRDPVNFVYGPNTFGAQNVDFATLTPTPGLSAPQDTDTSGKLLTDSVRLPTPKGDPANPNGIMSSVGELGYIHSGMQGRYTAGAGTPWRTLRLQAQPTAAGSNKLLPDWIITDLFAAPVVTSAATPVIAPASVEASLLKPTSRSTAGKINLNALIYPFSPSATQPTMARLEPLRALFYGARKTDATTPTLAATDLDTLVGYYDESAGSNKVKLGDIPKYNVVSGTNGLQGTDYGANGNAAGVYFAPGQLAEIKGIGDAGEAGEGLLREVLELATARGGNVFSIYSVGQAIRQDARGNVVVLGERRCQRVVERWENPVAGTTATTVGAVANDPTRATVTTQFRTVYSRTLTP